MIWIRCEANSNVGHGHLGRCRALAEELEGRGYEVKYACTKESEETFKSYGIKPEIVHLYGLPEATRYTRNFYIIDDYRLKGKFNFALEIEDDYARPLIRKEFTKLKYAGREYRGASGQSALEALYEGRYLILHTAAKNQEKYFSHFIAVGVASTDKFHKGMKDAAIAYSIKMKPANKYLASKAVMRFGDDFTEKQVLELRNKNYIRATCADNRIITPEEHLNWWEENYESVQGIYAHNEFIGVVVIIKGEISLYIKKEFQGLCYGEVVLDSLKGRPLKARIRPDNYPSLKLFTKCGFIKNGDYYCRD